MDPQKLWAEKPQQWLDTKYFKMAAMAGLAFFKQCSVILPKPNNFFESR